MIVPPLIMEPQELRGRIGDPGLLIIDVSAGEAYTRYHIPGAVHLEYAAIVTNRPPVMGLLPSAEQLSRVFSGIGLTPDTHIVAYDDEGGTKAARLLWTLDVLGHPRGSLLDGGLTAWVNEQHPVNNLAITPTASVYEAVPTATGRVDHAHILARLGDPKLTIVDARTAAEYRGEEHRAARNGHIPGAVNIEWSRTLDHRRHLRLKPEGELRALYEDAGVTPDKEVVVYCHSHRRSAHTYIVLKSLGYGHIKGYPGSWSDWGNREDAPVAP